MSKFRRDLLWRKARRMGFDCVGFFVDPHCADQGFHYNVWMGDPYRDCGKTTASVAVRCCGGLVGNMYLEDDEVKRAEIAVIRRAVAYVRRRRWPMWRRRRVALAPLPIVVRETIELSSPWEPGSTAFWLDPELWSRTPEVNGRPEKCWMFLDAQPRQGEKPRQRFEIRKIGDKIVERHYIG